MKIFHPHPDNTILIYNSKSVTGRLCLRQLESLDIETLTIDTAVCKLPLSAWREIAQGLPFTLDKLVNTTSDKFKRVSAGKALRSREAVLKLIAEYPEILSCQILIKDDGFNPLFSPGDIHKVVPKTVEAPIMHTFDNRIILFG